MATVRLHSVDATAEILEIGRNTVYRLIASGALESCDVAPPGSHAPKTRVSDEAIAKFIAARTRQATHLRIAT